MYPPSSGLGENNSRNSSSSLCWRAVKIDCAGTDGDSLEEEREGDGDDGTACSGWNKFVWLSAWLYLYRNALMPGPCTDRPSALEARLVTYAHIQLISLKVGGRLLYLEARIQQWTSMTPMHMSQAVSAIPLEAERA